MSIVALAGGVGGAKLARGLARVETSFLTVIVNTGDDFEHLGLTICPDIDTMLYTLAGIANRAQGWGIEDETWAFLKQLESLGLPTWFRLGDRDLATHILRRQRLGEGKQQTEIVAELARRLGVRTNVLPMSNRPVRTMVETSEGVLTFQDYFVRRKCSVPVTGFRFVGSENAEPTAEIVEALHCTNLRAVVICPSNPYVSIAPILSVPGMREAIARAGPVVAVSPIIGGSAVKGPAAKMMRELGHVVSALGVARQYVGLVDGLVIDQVDHALAGDIHALGMRVHVTRTIMNDDADRERLATECLAFADGIASS